MSKENLNVQANDYAINLISQIKISSKQIISEYNKLLTKNKEMKKYLHEYLSYNDVELVKNNYKILSQIDLYYLNLRSFNRKLKEYNVKISSLRKINSDDSNIRLAIVNAISYSNALVRDYANYMEDFFVSTSSILQKLNKNSLKEFTRENKKNDLHLDVKSLASKINTQMNNFIDAINKGSIIDINKKYSIKSLFLDTYHPLLNQTNLRFNYSDSSYKKIDNFNFKIPYISIEEIEQYYNVELSNKDSKDKDLCLYVSVLKYLYKKINEDPLLNLKFAELDNKSKREKIDHFINKSFNDILNNIKLINNEIILDSNMSDLDESVVCYILRINGYSIEKSSMNTIIFDQDNELNHYLMYKKLNNDYLKNRIKIIDINTVAIDKHDDDIALYNENCLGALENALMDLENTTSKEERLLLIDKIHEYLDNLIVYSSSQIMGADISSLYEYSNMIVKIDANEYINNIKKWKFSSFACDNCNIDNYLDYLAKSRKKFEQVRKIYAEDTKDITLDLEYIKLDNDFKIKKGMDMYKNMDKTMKDYYDEIIDNDFNNIFNKLTDQEVSYMNQLYLDRINYLKELSHLNKEAVEDIVTYIKLNDRLNYLTKYKDIKEVSNISENREEEIIKSFKNKINNR